MYKFRTLCFDFHCLKRWWIYYLPFKTEKIQTLAAPATGKGVENSGGNAK